MMLTSSILATLLIGANAFTAPNPTFASRSSTSLHAEMSRTNFLSSAASIAIGSALIPKVALADEVVKLPSGVSYTITTAGDGPKPEIGELAAIRFKALCVETGNQIDDIFNTPEPYYTRVGSGGMLKGVEEVIPKMRVGDRWVLTIPGNLAFGPKGRPSSAGKPRIPSNATIQFDVEMVGLPGKEPELIELIGDV